MLNVRGLCTTIDQCKCSEHVQGRLGEFVMLGKLGKLNALLIYDIFTL